MPFGIPSEDFHGGFGLPHDEDEYDACNDDKEENEDEEGEEE